MLACKKKTWYWTRRAVLIIASEAEEYADPHTKTHRHKKKQVLLVVVLRFHPVVAAFPKCETQQTAQLHFFCTLPVPSLFFCTLPVPSLFFYTLPVTSLFFCTVSVTLHFFCTLPVPSLFFYTLPVTVLFFCTLSVTSHFFCNLVVASFFFCNPLSQLHFFCNGKIGDPSVAFFLQDVFASLDCCNSGCISVCTFAFILHFFRFFPYFFLHFELQVAKKNATGKTHWFPLLFFCASVLGDVPGCIFRNPVCEPIVGSHSLSQLCALPSSGGGVCD